MWVMPKIFDVAFKILWPSCIRLEFLAYTGMRLYLFAGDDMFDA